MRYEIGFGVGFDRDNKPLDPVHVQECVKMILVEASKRFGGCNIVSGQGAWLDPSGNLVVEESRTLVIDSSEDAYAQPDGVDEIIRMIRHLLNQRAVHFASYPVTTWQVGV